MSSFSILTMSVLWGCTFFAHTWALTKLSSSMLRELINFLGNREFHIKALPDKVSPNFITITNFSYSLVKSFLLTIVVKKMQFGDCVPIIVRYVCYLEPFLNGLNYHIGSVRHPHVTFRARFLCNQRCFLHMAHSGV